MDSDGNVFAWVAPQDLVNLQWRPKFIGRTILIMLYGVSFITCARYFMGRTSRKDSFAARLYIGVVMILNTVSAILMAIEQTYLSLAQERNVAFVNGATLIMQLWGWVFTANVVLAQAFLMRRAILLMIHASPLVSLRDLLKRPAFLFVSMTLALSMIGSLIGYAATLSGSIKWYKRGNQDTITSFEVNGMPLGLLAAAVADITITTTLGVHWLRFLHENRGFNPKINTLLRRLVAFTLSTALYTTVPAVIGAVLTVIEPVVDEQAMVVSNVFREPLPQLYTLSLFSTLTIRKPLGHDRPFQPSLPTMPTLREGKLMSRPMAALVETPASLGSASEETGPLEVRLESGGFQIRTFELANTGFGDAS